MKQKKTMTSVALILLGLGGLHAQETPTAAGGEATGIGGTTSYSVGQVVYITNTGTNESVAQGVQQPYEISTMVGINETTINLEMNVYPNPTENFITLKVEKTENLNYQLFDMQGKLIESKAINNSLSKISLENQLSTTYFLKVTKNSQIVKTFKIIKN